MFRLYLVILISIACFWDVPSAYGQKATEIFIPIGQSPGLSGKYSIIGKIDSVDYQTHSMRVIDSSGSYIVKVMEETQIWLDKSELKLTNVEGTLEDCQEGRLIEVRYKNAEKKEEMYAEWIKVQITSQ
jgi:hypothetical protein